MRFVPGELLRFEDRVKVCIVVVAKSTKRYFINTRLVSMFVKVRKEK